jgi:hypothetical protein
MLHPPPWRLLPQPHRGGLNLTPPENPPRCPATPCKGIIAASTNKQPLRCQQGRHPNRLATTENDLQDADPPSHDRQGRCLCHGSRAPIDNGGGGGEMVYRASAQSSSSPPPLNHQACLVATTPHSNLITTREMDEAPPCRHPCWPLGLCRWSTLAAAQCGDGLRGDGDDYVLVTSCVARGSDACLCSYRGEE